MGEVPLYGGPRVGGASLREYPCNKTKPYTSNPILGGCVFLLVRHPCKVQGSGVRAQV